MPLVRIDILKGRPASERKRLLEAVHAALVEAFHIPDDDRTQQLIEHDPVNFEIPPGGSEKYTLVQITAFPGRSPSAKGNLYGAIVRNLGARGNPPGEVMITVVEPPLENWGIRAGSRPARWTSVSGSMSSRPETSWSRLQ
jgi:phenylpyruvate tautomerase PptA (4-oxalocrotonate tautomerase family)